MEFVDESTGQLNGKLPSLCSPSNDLIIHICEVAHILNRVPVWGTWVRERRIGAWGAWVDGWGAWVRGVHGRMAAQESAWVHGVHAAHGVHGTHVGAWGTWVHVGEGECMRMYGMGATRCMTHNDA